MQIMLTFVQEQSDLHIYVIISRMAKSLHRKLITYRKFLPKFSTRKQRSKSWLCRKIISHFSGLKKK